MCVCVCVCVHIRTYDMYLFILFSSASWMVAGAAEQVSVIIVVYSAH